MMMMMLVVLVLLLVLLLLLIRKMRMRMLLLLIGGHLVGVIIADAVHLGGMIDAAATAGRSAEVAARGRGHIWRIVLLLGGCGRLGRRELGLLLLLELRRELDPETGVGALLGRRRLTAELMMI